MNPQTGKSKHKWTDRQKEWLKKWYVHFGYNRVADEFNRCFKLNLSRSAVTSMAYLLGLQGQEHTDFTLAEVCDMLGCCQASLRMRIKRGTVKAKKVLGDWVIDAEELAKLAEYHRKDTPWRAISSGQAAQRLGYTVAAFNMLIHRGSISAVRRGKIWMVRLDEIEQAEKYMQRTGHTRVPWAKLKAELEKVRP